MVKNRTLLLIKPNAVKKNKIGHILMMLENHNFIIKSIKSVSMTADFATQFYAMHQGKSFFKMLVRFMTSGTTIAVELYRENAVSVLRDFIGSTNPEDAEEGTIRQLFGDSLTENAVHASDSIENAEREINLVFNNEK